ncbi:MAG: DinB family protein [Bacteroidetes bacterium]|nr:DinB family protein [Bacteroidota bacterium]
MKEKFIDLFNYEEWADTEIINAVEKIHAPSEKILSLMSHVINARIIWLCRIKNIKSDTEVWKVYSKDELYDKHKRSAAEMLDFIKVLKEVDLENELKYENSKGEKFSSRLYEILFHLTHHSAYHRGQIVQLLKSSDAEFPYTDYIHYARKIKNKN